MRLTYTLRVIKSAFIFCLFISYGPTLFATPADTLLVKEIQSAQRNLNQTQTNVGKERQKLVENLNQLEQEVIKLQKATAVARRLADEETLGLTQLKQRLERWNQQQNYQQNLLNRFISQHSSSQNASGATLAEQIEQVTLISRQLERSLVPVWQKRELVIPGGALQTLPTLSLGPITWYWSPQAHEAGLTQDLEGHLQSLMVLEGDAGNGIKQLYDNNTGSLTFNPTLDHALIREQQAESPLEHVTKGGIWVIPILLFALFALGIALVKAYQLVRLPRLIRFNPSQLKSFTTANVSNQIPLHIDGMQRKLLEISLQADNERERDDRLFIALQDNKHYLERWIGAIAVTASVSPLLGLLGTVSGMIETFKMMTLFGSGNPEVVSGGIAQALVTTELGLVVAIPALIINALLSRRAKSYYQELESFALLISQNSSETRAPDPTSYESEEIAA